MLTWNPSKLTTKGKALLAKARQANARSRSQRRRPDPVSTAPERQPTPERP
nr:hypothetical protein [Clostridium sp. OF09-10]